MAYLFLSDGAPDAQEYHNNYFQYDETDTKTVARITTVLQGGDPTDQVVRARLRRICQESFRRKAAKATSPKPTAWPRKLFNRLQRLVRPWSLF
jgi:hypothetical protein